MQPLIAKLHWKPCNAWMTESEFPSRMILEKPLSFAGTTSLHAKAFKTGGSSILAHLLQSHPMGLSSESLAIAAIESRWVLIHCPIKINLNETWRRFCPWLHWELHPTVINISAKYWNFSFKRIQCLIKLYEILIFFKWKNLLFFILKQIIDKKKSIQFNPWSFCKILNS